MIPDYNSKLFHAVALCAILVSPVLPVLAGQQGPPPPSAPRPLHFPVPIERTLKNGLRVIVVPRSDMPLISTRLMVASGSASEAPALAGLAQVTAQLLTRGTLKRTAPEIAKSLETLGGSIESGAGWDSSSINLTVIATHFEEALTILAEVARQPAFKEEELEWLREETLDSLRVSLSQPGVLARLAAQRLVFGNAPYGHPLGGTPESIARIKRAEIASFYKDFYRPDNAVLLIVGNIGASEALRGAEQLLGDWVSQAKAVPTPPAQDFPLPGRAVVVIDKPDAGQAALVLARKGIKRSDPDYFPALVTNAVLGGGYSARLNEEIRVKRGLSYGASSSLEPRRDVGFFIEATQTKNQSGAEVASLMLQTLSDLSRQMVPPSELLARKTALTGAYARALETNEGFIEADSLLTLYELDQNEINTFRQKVEAVTSPEVEQLAASRLNTDDVKIVIVGDSKQFLSTLKKDFPQINVIPVGELDLNSSKLRRGTP